MSEKNAPRRVVMLDRDGTINVDVHYLADPDHMRLLPGAASGLRRLRDAGFEFAVMTNQSGIAHGRVDPALLPAIHARLEALLAEEGVRLAGIYVCPHKPEDGCACRKPEPGLVRQAQRDIPFDPADSFMIGDKEADVDLGLAVGATPILVRTGHGAEAERAGVGRKAAYVADNLDDAATFILNEIQRLPVGAKRSAAGS